MSGPPEDLVRALVGGPVAALAWHPVVDSTNALAAAAAAEGAPELSVFLADEQTAGRGRLGRRWSAPPGSSLLVSVLLRPRRPPSDLPLLPLLAGLALAETAAGHARGRADVALKWPNDLLVDGRKAAGVLVEAPSPGVAIVGIGCNVDWRGVARPSEAATAGLPATSLAEAVGGDVDRWRLLAGLLGVLARRYAVWGDDPRAFLPAYRARCATTGSAVRVSRVGAGPLEGVATGVADDGALIVQPAAGPAVRVAAGDVEHVRPR